MPAKSKPAAIKPPAKEEKPAAKTEAKPVPKSLPVPLMSAMPRSIEEMGKVLARDILKRKAVMLSDEKIDKFLETEWERVKKYRVTNLVQLANQFYASTGGIIYLAALDNVQAGGVIDGCQPVFLQGKTITTRKLPGTKIIDTAFADHGVRVNAMRCTKFPVIDLPTVQIEREQITEVELYNALLAVAKPNLADYVEKGFNRYDLIAFEGQVRFVTPGFHFFKKEEVYTDDDGKTHKGKEIDALDENGWNAKFLITPVQPTSWEVKAWAQPTQNGSIWLAAIEAAEMEEIRVAENKTQKLGEFYNGRVCMCVVQRSGQEQYDWNDYQGTKTWQPRLIALIPRPDDFDPVEIPERVAPTPRDEEPEAKPLTVVDVVKSTGLSAKELAAKVRQKSKELNGLVTADNCYLIVLKELGVAITEAGVEMVDVPEEIEEQSPEQPSQLEQQPETPETPDVVNSSDAKIAAAVAEVQQYAKKTASEVQEEAIKYQSEAALTGSRIGMVEALGALAEQYKYAAQQATEKPAGAPAKPAKPALAPPVEEMDYTKPESDTPVLKQVRATATKNKTWDFEYSDLMDLKKYLVGVNEKTLSKEVFDAFMAANRKK